MESTPSSHSPRPSQSSPSAANPMNVVAPPITSTAGEKLASDAPVLTSGVTFRVVVLSLLLAFVFGYVMPIIDVRMNNTFLGSVHLPPGALAVLLILLLIVNPLLKLLSRRLAFTRNEVLTVYISCLFSSLVPGHGAESFFVSNLIGPFYFATRENKWLEFLQPSLKPWFTPALMADGGTYGPKGHQLVESWYIGLRPTDSIPWSAWLVPLFAWGVVIFASYVMLACLSVMLRAQWAEHEALAFPLLRLPLAMTEDDDKPDHRHMLGTFFRNPVMWQGFAISFTVQLMNGINFYFPLGPRIPLTINLNLMFTEAPWNQMAPMGVSVMFLIVGFSYLLTSEVSFSLWFFVWFIQMQYIAAYYLGFVPTTLPPAIGSTSDGGAKTFVLYQQVGCYLSYMSLVLWTGRAHFGHVARRALGRAAATEAERSEAMSYPVAFWGFWLAFTLIILWTVAAGVSVTVALILWFSYLIISLALTRVVVEGGLFYAQQGWTPLGPIAQIFNSGPGTVLDPVSLVPASFLQGALMTDMRAFVMPGFMHSFKLAHDQKISARPLLALITAVILITSGMAVWMRVRMGYDGGGLQLNPWFAKIGPQQPAINAQRFINGTRDATWTNLIWLALGALGGYAMMLARSRFIWFPFHPIGMLMSLTAPVERMWFSIFLGWLCKVLITRIGGNDTYRKLVPAFLGMALGDVVMMLFWLIIDGWQGRSWHNLMPG